MSNGTADSTGMVEYVVSTAWKAMVPDKSQNQYPSLKNHHFVLLTCAVLRRICISQVVFRSRLCNFGILKHMSRCDLFALAAPGKPVYWTGYLSVHRMPSGDGPADCHTARNCLRQDSHKPTWGPSTKDGHNSLLAG